MYYSHLVENYNEPYIKIDSIKLKHIVDKVEKYLIDVDKIKFEMYKKETEEYNLDVKKRRDAAILEQYNKYKNKKIFWLFKRKTVISLEEFVKTEFEDCFYERIIPEYNSKINDSYFHELKTLISYNCQESYDISLPLYLLKYIKTNFGFTEYNIENIKMYIKLNIYDEIPDKFLNSMIVKCC